MLAGCCLLSLLVLIGSHAAAVNRAAAGEGTAEPFLSTPLLGTNNEPCGAAPPCLEAGMMLGVENPMYTLLPQPCIGTRSRHLTALRGTHMRATVS